VKTTHNKTTGKVRFLYFRRKID